MKIPREARNLARELFGLALRDGRILPSRVSEISDAILRQKPRHHFLILKEFTRLVRLELLEHHADVDSAVPLPESLRQQIRSDLSKRLGPDATFQFRVNPRLLGGMRVKVGSDVWDGSIRARLDAIEKSF